MSLPKAVEKVAAIYDLHRDVPITREDAAKAIGYTSLSGPASSAVGALRSYGLLENVAKGTVRVTEQAKAILHPLPGNDTERLENLRAAALAPSIFKKVYDAFGDSEIPKLVGVMSFT